MKRREENVRGAKRLKRKWQERTAGEIRWATRPAGLAAAATKRNDDATKDKL